MKKLVITSVAVAILMVGCGGGKPKPKPIAPSSHQATFVESYSSAEITIRANGIGEDVKSASKDASLAAIWFALNGGDNPLLQLPKEKNAFSMVAEDFYKNANKYISYDGGIKSKKKEGGEYKIAKVFRINVAMLKNDLASQGIIKTIDGMSEDVMLPIIAVIPKDKSIKNDPAYDILTSAISEYLQDRDYEVKVLNTNKKTDKLISSALALSGNFDPMTAAAVEIGSDIYLQVSLEKTSRNVAGQKVQKASVSIKAFYTATNKQVGASTGFSQERVVSSFGALAQEGANDAANKVLDQIKKSWKKEIKRGKPFRVVASTNLGSSVDDALNDALRSTCKQVRRNAAGKTSFDFTLNCKGIQDAYELNKKIKENYKGAGQIFKELDSGSMLIIKIANSEEDEIVIE